MQKYSDITRRQIEILGIFFSETFPKPVRVTDLACFFRVDDISIQRDLNKLRSMGIDIHSARNEGVVISSTFKKRELVELVLRYFSMSNREEFFDKSTLLLAEKYGPKILSNFIMLQICAEYRLIAEIKYVKYENHIESLATRKLKPLLLFQNEGHWCVLSQELYEVKQFLLEKIDTVSKTDIHFEREELPNMAYFNANSWRTQPGNINYSVKLLVSDELASHILSRQMVYKQKITQLENGLIIFEAIVNDLSEIAAWIAGKGKGIVVEEPKILREMVIKIARGTFSNYK